MIAEEKIYIKLREQINKMPIGLPTTESGVELRILKHLFTPDEARIALQLNIILEPVEKIYKRVKKTNPSITIDDLKILLNRLAMKGAILSGIKNGKISYSYLQFAIGIFEYQVDRMTKEFFQDCEDYLHGGFKNEFYKTKIPQLRTVPIHKSLPSHHSIAIYDDIRDIIQQTDEDFGVMNCICKQGKDLIGKDCQVTDIRETCITFPNTASLFKKLKISRPVSKEEVLEILDKAEESGLVIQPGNTQYPKFICCCCGDCCGVLTVAKTYSKPAEFFSSNYNVVIDSKKCKGCGSCLRQCQMEALVLSEDKITVDLDRCIGCGLCVSQCPNEAISLKKKKNITIPPRTQWDLYKKIMIKKLGPWKTLKMGLKLKLGMKV
jgi:NAD-dependent dihydropyrimidine dehydrogenase PreA subunit/predicted transcriptional regulator